ncbi:MAG TPA: tetratricopeptide repeat protein [Desulfobulbus sp.]|nr:tetratricopeptide repeat protein [Desulfobulbus sp.]
MTNTRTTREFVVISFFWTILALMVTFGILTTLRGPAAERGAVPTATADKKKEIEEKIAIYKSILQEKPDSLKALIGLGDLYFDDHRFEQAIETFLKARAIAPRNVHVANDLGLLYLNTGEPDKAMAQFNRALEIDPAHLESLYYIGMIHVSRGEPEQGLEVLGKVLAAGPGPDLARQVNREMEAIRRAMKGAGQ